MKKGQKLKRVCAGCGEIKEQVKDKMMQSSKGWTCGPCLQIGASELMQKLPASFQTRSISI